ncbi:MAG: acetyl-CoA C-acyltransferase, partial [Lysobacter sp.]
MSKQVQDAYIVAATRTPVAKARGAFRNTRPDDMLAHVLKAVIAQAPGIDVNRIDDAIIGCAMPEGEQGMNVARIAVLLAGLPNTIAAQTINRFCSSGLQAVALAADQIRLGNADLMLAGGTESMTMVPMMGNKVALSPNVFRDDHVNIAYGMGITAEKVAEEWKVSREDQDAFALESHLKALAAIEAGEFKDEISPLEVVSRRADLAGDSVREHRILVDTDEGPRPGSTIEGLARLRPVFRNAQFGGTVTAGNSSQMSDGAGAVLLASAQAIKDYGLTPLARFVSFSVAGVRPEVM